MKLILTLALSFVTFVAFSQDSISRHAFTSSFYAGVPFQQDQDTKEWYRPGYDISLTQSYAFRLKNRFFLSLGVGINFQEYRTQAYRYGWTTYGYSPTLGYYNVQNHVDDYERQDLGKFIRIKVPLLVEYMPQGKWTPYAKAGFVFDAQIARRYRQVYAGTQNELPYNEQSYNSEVYDEDLMLSASFSAGVKYGSGDVELLLGLSSQIGLTNLNSYYRANNANLVGEVSIRKTIPNTKFPHQRSIKIDSTNLSKKNYLYMEGMGAIIWASLNYERTIFTIGKNRINARTGVSPQKSGGKMALIVPVGLSWIYGRKHGLEVGSAYVHTFGPYSDAHLATQIGYRLETNKNLLVRLNAAGWWQFDSNQFFIVPGVALGLRF